MATIKVTAVFVGASVADPSGGHLNPAVTLMVAINGGLEWNLVPAYIPGQQGAEHCAQKLACDVGRNEVPLKAAIDGNHQGHGRIEVAAGWVRHAGAHLHPAVTLMVAINGGLEWNLVPAYIAGQQGAEHCAQKRACDVSSNLA